MSDDSSERNGVTLALGNTAARHAVSTVVAEDSGKPSANPTGCVAGSWR